MGHFSVEIYAPPGSDLSGNLQVIKYLLIRLSPEVQACADTPLHIIGCDVPYDLARFRAMRDKSPLPDVAEKLIKGRGCIALIICQETTVLAPEGRPCSPQGSIFSLVLAYSHKFFIRLPFGGSLLRICEQFIHGRKTT